MSAFGDLREKLGQDEGDGRMTIFMLLGFGVHEAMARFRLACRKLFNNYRRTGERDSRAYRRVGGPWGVLVAGLCRK